MQISIEDNLLFAVFGFGAGLFFFFSGFQRHRKLKLIQNIPTSKVRSVAMGLAELSGVAAAGPAKLQSPFAQNECVFYQYKVEELRRTNKSTYWATIQKRSSETPFYLKDDTGQIMILPKNAELYLDKDHSYGGNSFFSGRDSVFEEGLARLGVNNQTIFGLKKTLRADETYIVEGDPVYVLGKVSSDALGENGAGGPRCAAISYDQVHKVLILSDKSEKDVISRMSGYTLLALYGGPVISITALVILLSELGFF